MLVNAWNEFMMGWVFIYLKVESVTLTKLYGEFF